MRYLMKPQLGTQINWGHQLAKGLVGCWIFNEGCGNKVYDISGYGNHGTINNMAFPPTVSSGWNPGKFGSALAFDGVDDYVDCGNDASLNINGSVNFTFSAWVYLPADLTSAARIINRWGTDISAKQYLFFILDNERPALFVGDGSSEFSVQSSTSIPINSWKHIVGVREGTELRLYLDGINVGIGTAPDSIVNTSQNTYIGGGVPEDLHYFNGTIVEVRIYNRVLSAFEVGWLYHDPFCMFAPEYEEALLYAPAPTISGGGNINAAELLLT